MKLSGARPPGTRRNVFVSGESLENLIWEKFEVQGVCFVGVNESQSCYWMNSALGPGAERWLGSNAGLHFRILSSGGLSCD